MKKNYLGALMFLWATQMFAQTNNVTILPGGEVFPRVSLTSTTDNTTVGPNALSQLVYNTNSGLTDGVGYYYWNSTNWTKLGAGAIGTLPSTAIVLSETSINSPLQTAGYINSGKTTIPFQGWEKIFSATNAFSNPNGENTLIQLPSSGNTFWAFWGGDNGLFVPTYFNTGKYYNPTTDVWTNLPATPSGSSDARSGHSMAFNGTNLYVWGGKNSLGYLSTGMFIQFTGAGANTMWTQMENNSAPSPRSNHSITTWGNSGLIIWGGLTATNTATNSGSVFSSTTNSWANTILTTNAPLARYNHIAFLTSNFLYVWGGQAGNGAFHSDGGRYDLVNQTWVPLNTANVPVNDANVSVAYASSGVAANIFVTGGGNNLTNTVGRYYSVNLNTWTNIPSLKAPKLRNHTSTLASYDGKEYAVLWGGLNAADNSSNDKVYTFNITDGVWLDPADAQPTLTPIIAPSKTFAPFMVWDSQAKKIMVYGGYNPNTAPQLFYSTGGTFNPLSPKPYYLFKKQ